MKKQAFNPYLPTYEYIPDGEPRVFGDRVYVYGSHDRAQGDAYCQNDYVCWSAPTDDLGNWRYEGVIFKKCQEPSWTVENDFCLYAPDVVQGPDGRYYLYYCMEGAEVMSVAVCDTPAGSYEYLGHMHFENGYEPGSSDGDWVLFDPGVLVDDDGRVYVYSGFNPFFPFKPEREYVGAYVMEVKQDMVTIVGEPKVIIPRHDDSFCGHDFFEASSIRKIGDTYYFVYSSQQCHELCYATSKYPDRDFRFGGTIISNIDVGYQGNQIPLSHGGNNHGGLVKIGEQWYSFYHRHTNLTPYSRQGSAEPITIAEDGSIAQAEMTSCGLNGGPLEGKGRYEAGIVCNLFSRRNEVEWDFKDFHGVEERLACMPYLTQDGEDRECAPGTYIARIIDGAVLGYKYFAMKDAAEIAVFMRGTGEGILQVLTDRAGEPVAEIKVSSAEDWTEFAAPIAVAEGIYPLYFSYQGEGEFQMEAFELR